MYGIPAEISQEIWMLFQYNDGDPGARQQEAEHHPGRTTARNTAGGFDRSHVPPSR
jgi:hypothetical protein